MASVNSSNSSSSSSSSGVGGSSAAVVVVVVVIVVVVGCGGLKRSSRTHVTDLLLSRFVRIRTCLFAVLGFLD